MLSVVPGHVLQAAFRLWQEHRGQQRHDAALTIQRCYRGWRVRHAVSQQHRAALLVQTSWRSHRCQAQFAKIRRAARTIQVGSCLLNECPPQIPQAQDVNKTETALILLIICVLYTASVCSCQLPKRSTGCCEVPELPRVWLLYSAVEVQMRTERALFDLATHLEW